MNTSVESGGGGGVGGIGAPCHSGMWDYACGKWLATNPLPPSRSRWSVMEAADFRARQVKARLIATTRSGFYIMRHLKQDIGRGSGTISSRKVSIFLELTVYLNDVELMDSKMTLSSSASYI